ncbi:unnamed protein product [marine sediment metagenome]|uniref:Uncharacterized protein n=1 Tax=marine sediment metagenome TaxID=412755 RepID=X1VHW3_9ZZZZ
MLGVVLALALVPAPAAAQRRGVRLVPPKKKGPEVVGNLRMWGQWDWSDQLSARLKRIRKSVPKKNVHIEGWTVRRDRNLDGTETCRFWIRVNGLKGKDMTALVDTVIGQTKRYRVYSFKVQWN